MQCVDLGFHAGPLLGLDIDHKQVRQVFPPLERQQLLQLTSAASNSATYVARAFR
jgi:hypothetical protein